MTKSEMRFLRRELISRQLQYWEEWASFYGCSYEKLTFVKNTVKNYERAYYGKELQAYK